MKKILWNGTTVDVLCYGLFWTWNLIFLAFMLLGFAPLMLPELVLATQANIIPLSFAANALLLILIPIVAVILGITLLRREPRKLFALGYAVEGPLMLLVAIRIFVIRELNTTLLFVMIVAALGMLTFVWDLLDKKISERGALLTHLRVLGLTLFALVMLYASIWLAFYALPVAGFLIRGLIEWLTHLGDFARGLISMFADFPRNLAWIPFMLFGMLTFMFSATLFVLMPLVVPILVLTRWWRAVEKYIARFGKARAAILATATAGVCVFLFFFLNQQPQNTAFALLETAAPDAAHAQRLAAQEETLRAGLLNAYLAPQRYISSVGEVQHIREMYHSAFDLPQENFVGVERAYEIVASPLLYKPTGEPVVNARGNDGALFRESSKAAELYENYFDETIFDGERATVLNSLGSTWDAMGAQQRIQDAADREVHLNKQEITFTEHGDWADFELHEEYQNESGTRQEVVYYITLPESAVITGVWLGNSENRDERFAYRVSPRGAAQQVYREQVRVNVDPALVEQIGPRQYRVRVFPIEPKTLGYEARSEFGYRASFAQQGPPLHLWLTWRVMANQNSWTLPYLAEKRNVYWDEKTTRTANGQTFTTNDDAWLPTALNATAPITPTTHRFDFDDGQSVVAQPFPAAAMPQLPKNLRLAVVVDRSRSMQPLASDVQNALAQFKTISERGNLIDVYLTAPKYRGENATRVSIHELNPSALTYSGGQNPAELLQQFSNLRGAEKYDAVFVLTDGTGYALGASDAKPASVNSALWFIHLGGKFPLGYDDATLQEIQSTGGGVTGEIQDALNRVAVAYAVRHGPLFEGIAGDTIADFVDGYLWYTLTADSSRERFAEFESDEIFAPFATRRLVLTNVQRARASLEQLNTLDELHALAKQHSVVSPYSSMIVLVNEIQQKRLDELEKQSDRFDREVEEVGQTSPFEVTAVPEPHEYLLMALGGGLLFWFWRKRRTRAQMA